LGSAPRLPNGIGRSATGCGDAATAGIILALGRAKMVPQTVLRSAISAGTAKYASADPGKLDAKLAKRLAMKVLITELSC
jgi:fructose-1-phosphate kinase PfkB-like protein